MRSISSRCIPEPCPKMVYDERSQVTPEVTAARRAYARKWREQGYAFKEIAHAMGVSISRVGQILKKSGEPA